MGSLSMSIHLIEYFYLFFFASIKRSLNKNKYISDFDHLIVDLPIVFLGEISGESITTEPLFTGINLLN
jgi:hypothetical protein